MNVIHALMLGILVLLAPSVTFADDDNAVRIFGKIGDYAAKSRMYEVNGTIYRLPENIVVQNEHGKNVGLEALKQGVVVDIIGKKDHHKGKARVTFTKVVVYAHAAASRANR